MRRPTKGEILTNAAGKNWIVADIRTMNDFADDLEEGEELDPNYFQIDIVEGTDPDDIDADAFELDNTSLPEFLEQRGLVM
ncbi:hypothetical protein [Acidovorax sp. Q11]